MKQFSHISIYVQYYVFWLRTSSPRFHDKICPSIFHLRLFGQTYHSQTCAILCPQISTKWVIKHISPFPNKHCRFDRFVLTVDSVRVCFELAWYTPQYFSIRSYKQVSFWFETFFPLHGWRREEKHTPPPLKDTNEVVRTLWEAIKMKETILLG